LYAQSKLHRHLVPAYRRPGRLMGFFHRYLGNIAIATAKR